MPKAYRACGHRRYQSETSQGVRGDLRRIQDRLRRHASSDRRASEHVSSGNIEPGQRTKEIGHWAGLEASWVQCPAMLGVRSGALKFWAVSCLTLLSCSAMTVNPTSNAIHVIVPYRDAGTWVFDDARVGLHREPFVSGIPQMIDVLVGSIPKAKEGFRLLFSSQPFPGYQVELVKIKDEHGGTWYRWTDRQAEGWLCPALFRYFPAAPAQLYAKAEPLQSS
jgi:hypothetical protein